MSELKAMNYFQVESDYLEHETECEPSKKLYYFAAEADKVISELKEKIEELTGKLRHHKYKRCLDNSEICCEKKENRYNRALRKYSKDEADHLVRKSELWQYWEFRWLKLSEKFKEAK